MVMCSWVLTSYYGRRPIYLVGSAVNTVLLVALGVAASCGKSNSASLAQAALGLIVSVLFTLGAAPVSYAIIGETSAIRLRPLTTGMGRAAYYIVEIPCIFLGSYMLNPTVSPLCFHQSDRIATNNFQGGNLGGKCGYVWGATGFICLVTAYFYLPEMRGRSYREIDILFKRKVPARKWTKTEIDVQEDH